MTDGPCIVQGTKEPVFRGTVASSVSFDCQNCSHRLIENYVSDFYLSVRVKCSTCGAISVTPPLPPGEILPKTVVRIGDKGDFRIERPVDALPGVIIATDPAIAEPNKFSHPNPPKGEPLDIDKLANKYDLLSGGRLQEQKDSLQRYLAAKNPNALRELPFAWALNHISSCFSAGAVDFSQHDTVVSYTFFSAFNAVSNMWINNPRCEAIFRELANPAAFFHVVSQLWAAFLLFQFGNRIGFSTGSDTGKPNPDLYARPSGSKKIYLEVKSPQSLLPGGDGVKAQALIEATIVQSLKKVRSQINRSHPGMLIISSFDGKNVALNPMVEACTRILGTHGHRTKHLEGIFVMTFDYASIETSGGKVNMNFDVRYQGLPNPHRSASGEFIFG